MKRSQAALFDGIMFLLFASFSVTMVYAFLNEYGKAEDAALRSGYVLAYLQDAGKAIFFVDARSLKDVANPAAFPNIQSEVCKWDPESGLPPTGCTGAGKLAGFPYSDLSDPSSGCASLASFQSSTIADLLKKDLADGDSPTEACLDDRFGHPQPPGTNPDCTSHTAGGWNNVPRVPGKTALRCGLKELMKPLESSGFKYYAGLKGETTSATGALLPVSQQSHSVASAIDSGFRPSNHWAATQGNWLECQTAVSNGVDNILTIDFPFRVTKGTTLESMITYTLQTCIWPSKQGR